MKKISRKSLGALGFAFGAAAAAPVLAWANHISPLETATQRSEARVKEITDCAAALGVRQTVRNSFPTECEPIKERLLYTKTTEEHYMQGSYSIESVYTLPPRDTVTEIEIDTTEIRSQYELDVNARKVTAAIAVFSSGMAGMSFASSKFLQ